MMEIYTVGQITRYLKESLEANDFLADLWLSGELSNVSRSTAGHLYFTLKDPAGQMRLPMATRWWPTGESRSTRHAATSSTSSTS